MRQSLPESHRDDASVLSACLYPKVFEEYLAHLEEYGDLSKLETPVFMRGMDPGDLHAVVVENGKVLTIKFVSMGEMNDDGTRNLIFELNGIQRVVAIKVPNAEVVADHQPLWPILRMNGILQPPSPAWSARCWYRSAIR